MSLGLVISGGDTAAEALSFSSIIDGGCESASYRISDAERIAHPTVYVQNALFQVLDADDNTIWLGSLKEPTPNPDGTCTLEAVGFREYVAGREAPLYWQIVHGADWGGPHDHPFKGHFANDDSIDARIRKGHLMFQIKKNTDLNKNGGGCDVAETSRALFDAGADHKIKRVRFDAQHKKEVPKDSGNPVVAMRIDSSDDPASGTAGLSNESSLNATLLGDGSLYQGESVVIAGGGARVVTFAMWADRNATTSRPFKQMIDDIRLSGDAYRGTPGNWDSYSASEMVRDIADALGFDDALVSDTLADSSAVFNVLPRWHDQGSWADLIDEFAQLYAFKWGIWPDAATGIVPTIEFAPWSATADWHVRCFDDAICDANLKPSEDKYSHVIVAYRLKHSRRRRHVTVEISPNPFDALPGPPRERHYLYHLKERTHSDTLATNIANTIADELAAPRLAGTIGPTAYVLDGSSNEHPITDVRAGDTIAVDDYPTDAGPVEQILRIYGCEIDEGTGGTLSINELPIDINHLLWRQHKRRHRHHHHD